MNSFKIRAFSLVEAMIILVLISVAIMAMVPLISQKSASSGIQLFQKAGGNTFLGFGNLSKQKLGIGLNPKSVSTINAKLYTNNIGINYAPGTTAIYLGRDYNAGAYNTRVVSANSISVGQNACTGATVSIGSQANAAACATTNFHIGQHNGTNVRSSGPTNFSLNVANQELIRLNNNDFTIRHYNAGGAVTIFDYTSATKTFKFGKDVRIGAGGTGDLYLSNLAYSIGGVPEDDPKSSCNVCKDDDPACSSTYFDHATGTLGLQIELSSDRRLKNIIAKYEKGIDNIKKIDTYTYTYKDDKKKSLQVGLIAQKIAGIFDEAIHIDAKGFYSYERTPILYAMVNSVKSISARLDAVSKEQKSLNSRADKLLKMYK